MIADAGRRAPGDAGGSRGDRACSRDRILWAAIEVVAERGFAATNVKLVTARAGVSSRTYYAEFDDLEDCFGAVIDMGLEQAGAVIAQAYGSERDWEDATLTALASLLQFFDAEPLLTRIWFVEAMAAGAWAQERRERHVARLRGMVLAWWTAQGNAPPDPAALAGVMASVLGLIHMHVVTNEPGPLIDLLGPMMGLITAPYLGVGAAEREARRGATRAREIRAAGYEWSPPVRPVRHEQADEPEDPREDGRRALPLSLSAARARECLLFIAAQAERGSSPNNREIAAGTGIAHESQISRLLSELRRDGLLEKRSAGVGKNNAWELTVEGEAAARDLAAWEGEGKE